MHIFVADEGPPAVFVYTNRRALSFPRSAGFHDIAHGREKGGKQEGRANGCRSILLRGPASRGQLMNRAATISDRSAAFDGSAADVAHQVTSLTFRENAYAIKIG